MSGARPRLGAVGGEVSEEAELGRVKSRTHCCRGESTTQRNKAGEAGPALLPFLPPTPAFTHLLPRLTSSSWCAGALPPGVRGRSEQR